MWNIQMLYFLHSGTRWVCVDSLDMPSQIQHNKLKYHITPTHGIKSTIESRIKINSVQIGGYESRTRWDVTQDMNCQIPKPVLKCRECSVCNLYRMGQFVCVDNLVVPSQLPQIEFVSFPYKIDHQNEFFTGTESTWEIM